ncbi:MAG: bifunctional folylpolyglutamate synthase/dihydrofolate synthase [Deltaproteobacteria bacterium]|nr:bifunctional folylpolyglutamate synthase/dihydrofolate synthase [Deltaproteobacteria bacterium]
MEDYRQLLDWAYDLQKFGIKLGLSNTRSLLDRLGNPHEGLRTIHVGGTNGKGSVSAMVSAILTQAGYRVGFYSSPHLVDFEERFRIGPEMVSRDRVTDLMARVKAVVDHREPPTFFEYTTAMALLYFREERTDPAIMEVGLGGRLDATNVIEPMVSIITNISVEHTEYLGATIEQIAYEKAGIIKPGVPVVSAAKQPEVIRLFEETCRRQKSPFYLAGRDFKILQEQELSTYEGFERRVTGLRPNLEGPIQRQNMSLALAALSLLDPNGFPWNEDAIREGLSRVYWPGRFQLMHRDPIVVVDGAHNPGALVSLKETLEDRFPGRKIVLVLGIMHDKDIAEMMGIIAPSAYEIICTRPAYARAAEPGVLYRHARQVHPRVYMTDHLGDAVDRAMDRAVQLNGVVVVAGSLFTVGETIAWFRSRPNVRNTGT